MNGLSFRIIIAIAISFIVMSAFIFFNLYFTVIDYIRPSFRDEWFWLNTLLLGSKYFPVAVITALTLCFSLFFDQGFIKKLLDKATGFVRLIRPSIVLAMIFSCAYALIIGYVENSAHERVSKIESNSALARTNFEEAQESLKLFKAKKQLVDFEKANSLLHTAEILVPGDSEFGQLRSEIEMIKPKTEKPEASEPAKDYTKGKDIFDLLTEARDRFKKADWFGALYYAELADNSGSGNEKFEAENLINEIKDRIKRANIKVGQDPEAVFLNKKQKAILDDFPKNHVIEAYYALKALQTQRKAEGKDTDADIELWMPIITDKLLETRFFVEEIDAASIKTSNNSVLIKTNEKDGFSTILFAHRVLDGEFNEYLVDLEMIKLDAKSNILVDLVADYGKVIPIIEKSRETGIKTTVGYRLLTSTVKKDRLGTPTESTFLTGSLDEPNVFELTISGADLWRIAQAGNDYGAMSINDLLTLQDFLPKISWDIRPVQMELLDRLLRATSLLGLWLLACSIAWANRNRALKKPIFLMILTCIALPFLAYVVYQLGLWLSHNIIANILTNLGFTLGLITTISLPTLGVIFGIIALGNRKLD